jgi:hypothetical protein
MYDFYMRIYQFLSHFNMTGKRHFAFDINSFCLLQRRYDMNGKFQMQEGKNWILPKEMNANRFFWESHWLDIWSNHFCPYMGPNGGSVATDSGVLIQYLVT